MINWLIYIVGTIGIVIWAATPYLTKPKKQKLLSSEELAALEREAGIAPLEPEFKPPTMALDALPLDVNVVTAKVNRKLKQIAGPPLSKSMHEKIEKYVEKRGAAHLVKRMIYKGHDIAVIRTSEGLRYTAVCDTCGEYLSKSEPSKLTVHFDGYGCTIPTTRCDCSVIQEINGAGQVVVNFIDHDKGCPNQT